MDMTRFKELFDEYREDIHGIYEAKKMAKKKLLNEMIDDLCEEELTTEEKIDKIISVLELMNMKTD